MMEMHRVIILKSLLRDIYGILNSDFCGLNLVMCSLIEFTFHTVMSYALNVLR